MEGEREGGREGGEDVPCVGHPTGAQFGRSHRKQAGSHWLDSNIGQKGLCRVLLGQEWCW